MKALRVFRFVALSLLTMSNNCGKDEGIIPCASRSVNRFQVADLDEYSAYCFAGRLTGAEQAKQYVIDSEAEYKALFSCMPRPSINFTEFTLLAGKTKTSTGRSVASRMVFVSCQGPDYAFTVKLAPGLTQATAEVAYFAVIPKLPTGATVAFDVQLLP